MKISYEWLLQYITTSESIDTLSETLTEIGLEVEGVEEISSLSNDLNHVVVAEVQEVLPHPNADRLQVCKVYDGHQSYQVVCGAKNVKTNMKTAFAKIGAELLLKNGESLKIKKSKIRGEESFGMLCAEDELGLSDNHEGIMELDEYALVGTPFKEYLRAKDDYSFEIGLTPNRSDAMSHYGVARDLHAGMSLRNLDSDFNPIQDEFILKPSQKASYKVVLENDQCKRYCLAHIQNVSIQASPEWLQQKLRSIDLEPINNVVDVTNYILHSYGQPLHAFDASKIQEKTIIVGNIAEGTSFVSLEGTERKLHAEDLMIKDGNQNPLCIAGVFGGINSGVQDTTTDIVLESAYFDPVAVRKTAKNHGLNTDASFRFERGVDPELTLWALKKASELIVEIAEAQINEEYIDVNHLADDLSTTIQVRKAKITELIGNEIPTPTIKKIYSLLDIEILKETQDSFEVKIPAFRTDVTREADVIEEILRIYGYNKVEVPNKVTFSLQKEHLESFETQKEISTLLANKGYYEVLNNSLTASTAEPTEVVLLNPLSQDLAVMRTTMLDAILGNIQYNLNRNNKNLKFFEWGKTYHKIKNEYQEIHKLALALSGNYWSENWQTPTSPSNFFQLKGMLLSIFNKLGIPFSENPLKHSNFSEALTFDTDKESLGFMGKVSPDLCKKMGIKQEVWYAELQVEIMFQHKAQKHFPLQGIPKFPGSRRDLALVLDKNVAYSDLRNTALQINNTLLKKVNLFDVYQGKNLEEGKKSYGLSFSFIDETKTLEDRDIELIIEKILNAYKKEYNAILRS